MRLRLSYSLPLTQALRNNVELPLHLTLPDDLEVSLPDVTPDRPDTLTLALTTPVEAAGILIHQPPEDYMTPEIAVAEVHYLREAAQDLASALAFVTDSVVKPRLPLHGAAELLPDGPEDDRQLHALGPHPVSAGSVRTVHAVIRSIDPAALSAERFTKLMAKREGLHLYGEALRLETPVGQYRELWRLLESGFGVRDEQLTAVLQKYPPAQQLGFTRAELRELLTVRHRISHGKTKAGLRELRAAYADASKHLDRLKCLAERVVVTKSVWGKPSLAVDELSPLADYFTANGTAVRRSQRGKMKLVVPCLSKGSM